jgi:hypothetical protein
MKVTLHSQVHEWRERNEEGRVRIVRAGWDGRRWNFTDTFKDAPDWNTLTNPPLEDYEALRDVLWRKYQRKRLPWRFIEDLDKFLEKFRGPATESGSSTTD